MTQPAHIAPASQSVEGMYADYFLDYASYVILERAVPKINDGFKPVQRRILHAMDRLDDGRYNKVANIVGDTMKFHPHGDRSIADALVGLGQKNLLIDTQGNWGNILTGDPAAASRYIEARFTPFARDVVFSPKVTEWQLSYDGRNKEPVSLPVKFPLLLAQGAEGIAVGLSSKILPHNFNELIDASIAHLRKDFLHPEFKALLETVGPHGEFIDSNMGRTINPGHCIETAWFLLEEAKYRNWDKDITELALTILDWSWEWGWDKEFGGIINFKDCKNLPPQDYSQDMKFWWPQTEAVIATLYAYLATGNEKYLDMHKQISDWTYAHFPDKECGEWFGYLHRDGTPAQMAKGNLFKGPFHIPRMMIKGYTLCKEILDNKKSHL